MTYSELFVKCKVLIVLLCLCTFFCIFHSTDVTAESSSNQSSHSSDNTLAGTIIAAVLATGVGIYSGYQNNKQSTQNRELQERLKLLDTQQSERNNEFQIKLASINAGLAEEIEKLKNQLATEKAEKDARRIYEYNARKRLYLEFEPVLFQFSEFSRIAVRRIYDLAKAAREGYLYQGGWLAGVQLTTQTPRNYPSVDYMVTTIYRLFAPMAAFKLLQQKLTLVDLTVDPLIEVQYRLAKRLYASFSDDFRLAKSKPTVGYGPTSGYSMRQGIYAGILDMLAEAMIKYDDNNTHVMSFGDFNMLFFPSVINSPLILPDSPPILTDSPSIHPPPPPPAPPDSAALKPEFLIQAAVALIKNFHPKERSVLWRVLIAQAHIYQALIETYDLNKILKKAEERNNVKPLKMMSDDQRREFFEWRYYKKSEATDDKVFMEPFEAVENYFQEVLGDIMSLSDANLTNAIPPRPNKITRYTADGKPVVNQSE